MAKRTSSKAAVKPVLPSVRLYRRIAGVFLSLTVILLIVVLYVATVHATIRVHTQAEAVERQLELHLTAEPQQAQDVPASFFQETVDESKVVEVSGEGAEIPAKAIGTVTLVNTSTREQPLIATTRLLNQDGVLFRLTEGVTVPAQGEVVADVAADVAGKEGEIAPSRFTIPGLNETRQKEVYATSSDPMVGGTVHRSVLTQEEVDAAAAAFLEDMKTRLDVAWRAEISQQLDASELTSADVEVETSVPVGEETTVYTLSVHATFTGLYWDRVRMSRVAQDQLQAYVPDGRVLLDVTPDQVEVTDRVVNVESGTARLTVLVHAQAVLERTADVLNKENVIGLTAEEAERFLELQGTIQDAEVVLKPFWVRHVPRLKDHITVEVVE